MQQSAGSPVRQGLLAATALVVLSLVGCTGNDNPLDKDPGVYKGVNDPLTKQSADERAQVLSERLQRIQARE